MKVVVAHNHYGDRAVGGETTVFEQETKLLRLNGCETATYERTNAEIARWSPWRKATAPFRLGRSEETRREATALFERFRPDVLHVHNYKFALTPSIFKAAKDLGIATVLTLHNYRLICPGGQLTRNGEICEECLKKNPARVLWRRGCASKWSTRALQTLLYFETKKDVLNNVDIFVALTEFSKRKFVEGGLPASRICVKPNFIFDPFVEISAEKRRFDDASKTDGEEDRRGERRGALFVGRLSQEKGIRFLLEAWRGIDFPLTVVGGGPEEERVRRDAPSNVRFLGEKPRVEALKLMQNAEFLVFPSTWHEGFPMTIVEAAAAETPTIASNLGGRAEAIVDCETGLLFESKNVADFQRAVRRLVDEPGLARRMGKAARRRYENLYSPGKNFETLMQIYRAAIERRDV